MANPSSEAKVSAAIQAARNGPLRSTPSFHKNFPLLPAGAPAIQLLSPGISTVKLLISGASVATPENSGKTAFVFSEPVDSGPSSQQAISPTTEVLKPLENLGSSVISSSPPVAIVPGAENPAGSSQDDPVVEVPVTCPNSVVEASISSTISPTELENVTVNVEISQRHDEIPTVEVAGPAGTGEVLASSQTGSKLGEEIMRPASACDTKISEFIPHAPLRISPEFQSKLQPDLSENLTAFYSGLMTVPRTVVHQLAIEEFTRIFGDDFINWLTSDKQTLLGIFNQSKNTSLPESGAAVEEKLVFENAPADLDHATADEQDVSEKASVTSERGEITEPLLFSSEQTLKILESPPAHTDQDTLEGSLSRGTDDCGKIDEGSVAHLIRASPLTSAQQTRPAYTEARQDAKETNVKVTVHTGSNGAERTVWQPTPLYVNPNIRGPSPIADGQDFSAGSRWSAPVSPALVSPVMTEPSRFFAGPVIHPNPPTPISLMPLLQPKSAPPIAIRPFLGTQTTTSDPHQAWNQIAEKFILRPVDPRYMNAYEIRRSRFIDLIRREKLTPVEALRRMGTPPYRIENKHVPIPGRSMYLHGIVMPDHLASIIQPKI